MADIEIKLTIEELDKLLNVRDFWSEVIFDDGGEVAPGHDPFEVADFEGILEVPHPVLRDQGWDFAPVFSQSWNIEVGQAKAASTASYAPAWTPTVAAETSMRQAA